jgi:hypothetical protein
MFKTLPLDEVAHPVREIIERGALALGGLVSPGNARVSVRLDLREVLTAPDPWLQNRGGHERNGQADQGERDDEDDDHGFTRS